jgi:RNA polymerase sigma-70 factor (ECF subfamily)
MPEPSDRKPSRQEEVLSELLRVRERATAFCYAVLRNFHAAEDAYQEAALVVVRRMDEYTGSGFEPWFWTILRNVVGGRLRSARRTPVLADAELLERLAGFAGASRAPELEENVDRLAACLGKLGRTMRLVLHWRFLEEAGCDEIARRLGRTVQGAYALIKRGRQAVRECVRLRAQLERGRG